MTVASPPTVLYVTAPAEFGGLERVVLTLAAGMRNRGHAVHVLAILDEGGGDNPMIRALRDDGVSVTAREIPPRGYRLERAALLDAIGACRARVVHTHGARPDVVDGPAARRYGLATVSTLHGFTGGNWKNRFYEWLQVRAVRKCDAVVSVSRPMADRLRAAGVAGERVHVIANAWSPRGAPLARREARAALGVPPEGCRVGWVGRLSVEKGADVLLASLPLLGELAVGVSFVGSGPQEEMLRARAQGMGLGPRLTWHGVVPDAGRMLTAFDVLVVSSRTEGTPIVLFEAMAAGVPIVTTAVGGIPDVVTAGEAVLVPSEQPEALAAAIRSAFSDREAAEARARAAATVLTTRFGTEPWLDAYERIYEAVGESPCGARA
jgi:glycosyltransferase involved in cell wall biosynthesis